VIWKLLFRVIIVGLGHIFPKFRFSYGLILIVLMQFLAAFSLFAAWADSGSQPASVVRIEIYMAIGSSMLGWILGLALMRQAKRHAAMIKQNLDEYERKRNSEGF
jgi:uncharacterized membrane protein (DUF485 family)